MPTGPTNSLYLLALEFWTVRCVAERKTNQWEFGEGEGESILLVSPLEGF